jgi:hypothetical protein
MKNFGSKARKSDFSHPAALAGRTLFREVLSGASEKCFVGVGLTTIENQLLCRKRMVMPVPNIF